VEWGGGVLGGCVFRFVFFVFVVGVGFFVWGGGGGGGGGGVLPTPPVDRTLRSAVVKIVFYQSGR